jgi:hypothetical protein
MLPYVDHLVLVNSVLTSLPMLSFLEIPKGVRRRLDYYRSRFFGKRRRIRRNIDYLDGT